MIGNWVIGSCMFVFMVESIVKNKLFGLEIWNNCNMNLLEKVIKVIVNGLSYKI